MSHKPAVPSGSHLPPLKIIRDPSLPATIPTTSKDDREKINLEQPCRQRFFEYVYNKEAKTYCNRTFQSWLYIIMYSIIYIMFLSTYTLLLLYGALWIVRLNTNFATTIQPELLTYSGNGIGLTATPTGESNYPLIWYRKGHSQDYEKYINALDSLLVSKRSKRDLDVLGPCGKSPYGYGDSPCVVIRVNKQFHWAGLPLTANSTEAKIPIEVQKWLKTDKKLWLHCSGYHSYDKEHIGRISYYPDPPGIEPSVFPLKTGNSPVIAIQISNFTLGISLAVECKLWYVNGPSVVNFMLYVAPDDKVLRRTNVKWDAWALRDAVNSVAPRIIYVRGRIDLTPLFTGSPGVRIQVGPYKTIIGGDANAEIFGGGLAIYNQVHVIVQNLKITNPISYAPGEQPNGSGGIISQVFGAYSAVCGVDIAESEFVWVDHCEFSDDPWNSAATPENQRRHNGLVTVKLGASWISISNNIFRNHNMNFLIGHTDGWTSDIGRLKVTVYLNWFQGTTQRNPMVRYGEVHVLNNLYTDIISYGIGIHVAASVYGERNMFVNCRRAWGFASGTPNPAGHFLNVDNWLSGSGNDANIPNAVHWRPDQYYGYIPMATGNVEAHVRRYAGTW